MNALREGSRPIDGKYRGDIEGNHLATRKIEEPRSGGDRWRAESYVTVKVFHNATGSSREGKMTVSRF